MCGRSRRVEGCGVCMCGQCNLWMFLCTHLALLCSPGGCVLLGGRVLPPYIQACGLPVLALGNVQHTLAFCMQAFLLEQLLPPRWPCLAVTAPAQHGGPSAPRPSPVPGENRQPPMGRWGAAATHSMCFRGLVDVASAGWLLSDRVEVAGVVAWWRLVPAALCAAWTANMAS